MARGSCVPSQFGLTQPLVSPRFPIEKVNSNESVQLLMFLTMTAPSGDRDPCDRLAAADQYHQGSYDGQAARYPHATAYIEGVV
mgnify:CR=1 FL=1